MGGLLPAGGVPASGLGVSLVQEVGALAVEVDGALVVGQGLAITGVGGSQEAGQAIHCHWDGGRRPGCRLLGSPAALCWCAPQLGWRRRQPPVPTVDFGDGGARVEMPDPPGEVLWELLLEGDGDTAVMGPPRGSPAWGVTAHRAPW